MQSLKNSQRLATALQPPPLPSQPLLVQPAPPLKVCSARPFAAVASVVLARSPSVDVRQCEACPPSPPRVLLPLPNLALCLQPLVLPLAMQDPCALPAEGTPFAFQDSQNNTIALKFRSRNSPAILYYRGGAPHSLGAYTGTGVNTTAGTVTDVSRPRSPPLRWGPGMACLAVCHSRVSELLYAAVLSR